MALKEKSAPYEILIAAPVPGVRETGGVAVRYIDWIERDGVAIQYNDRAAASDAELTHPDVVAVIGGAAAAVEVARQSAEARVAELEAEVLGVRDQLSAAQSEADALRDALAAAQARQKLVAVE